MVKSVKIKDKMLEIPIIQGGMGVGVSLANLAGNVMKNGGMGVLSMAHPGYREPDFLADNLAANIRGFAGEVKKARETAGGRGLLGVNIMAALKNFETYVRAAADAAAYGEKVGADVTAPSLSRRLRLVENIVDSLGEEDISVILDELVGVFGASMMSYESVAIAYGAFYAVNGHGADGVLAAVNAGDDADTNGSICGNLCGAFSGAKAFPEVWRKRVEQTSGLDLRKTAELLLQRG